MASPPHVLGTPPLEGVLRFWWCKCSPNRAVPMADNALDVWIRGGVLTRREACELCGGWMGWEKQNAVSGVGEGEGP